MFLFLTKAILLHRKRQVLLTTLGVSAAFFLAMAQFGLLVGWIHTNTALINHAGVDLWLIAEKTPAWDYGTAIPRQAIYQARSTPGVSWAEGLFMAWNTWQRPDGRRVNVELVGLDKSNVGGPWEMSQGGIDCVHNAKTVVVDELFLNQLGAWGLGENFEMYGERATLGGICRGVRTFTASPHVFTSVEQAILYDKRYRDDEITYVMARCAPGITAAEVQAEMRRRIPHVEVLTSHEFAVRSAKYWMLETGIGITVVITALLGLAVGAVITSQAIYSTTQEYLPNYATLLALGFSQKTLAGIVMAQSAVIGMGGLLVGSLMFLGASMASSKTPIPMEMTSALYIALMLTLLLVCVAASFVSVRVIFKLDPIAVFRQ